MLHLLLVSTQMKTPKVALSDSTKELISLKVQNSPQLNLSSKEETILCNHCKRTASNGVRCLGMCVADNDYWNNSNVMKKIIYKSRQMIFIHKQIR